MAVSRIFREVVAESFREFAALIKALLRVGQPDKRAMRPPFSAP
jgi:hypothetical protein